MTRPYLPPAHHLSRGLLGTLLLATVAILISLAVAHHGAANALAAGSRIVAWARSVLSDRT